jgi:hypothetical protein
MARVKVEVSEVPNVSEVSEVDLRNLRNVRNLGNLNPIPAQIGRQLIRSFYYPNCDLHHWRELFS